MERERQKAIDRHVGSQLRKFRLRAEVSQTTLAEQLGVTFQQIQKYENGTNRIAPSRLVAVAEFLNIPLIKLFEGCPHPFGGNEAPESVTRSMIAAPTSGVMARPDVRSAVGDLLDALSRDK